MQTIKHGRASYTITDARQDFMGALLKCTGKHKRVKSKGPERRIYPPDGATMSTANYVRAYEIANSGRWPHRCGAPYGTESTSMYAGLTVHVTVPEGADMVELCSG